MRAPKIVYRELKANGAEVRLIDQLGAIEALIGDPIEEWADLLDIDASRFRAKLLYEAGLSDRTP